MVVWSAWLNVHYGCKVSIDNWSVLLFSIDGCLFFMVRWLLWLVSTSSAITDGMGHRVSYLKL